MHKSDSLIGIVNPMPNSTIMIYDLHASESGALAILDDLYRQVCAFEDKSVNWVFVVSTPSYPEAENIVVRRFPWVKKNWGYRYFFDTVFARKLLKEFNPDKVFSLQNKGISFCKKEQFVYLHLPFILCDHRFDIRKDGKTLWLYQNVVSKSIFRSLRKVDKTIVQTNWMKDALIEKAKVNTDRILVLQPDIRSNHILQYTDSPENRKRIFYPATAFTYKNHMTLLQAIKYAQEKGLKGYEVIFTICEDENDYTSQLAAYAKEHHLNVFFGGKIPREKVFEMYARSILVFPSFVESFGLPLLEASMSGTYVIASDCPFSREILKDYDKADFFEALDYNKLGELILTRCM